MSDELEFLPEDGGDAVAGPVWKVLVVDDDPEIHHVTRLVLTGFTYRDLRVVMLSASSAAGACRLLAEHPDIAVILLDVVMETDSAGLDMVRRVREEMGMTAVRIILRTGQPGQAPERDVILRYDINDYKAKTEMTAQKLLTATVAGLRGFEAIRALEESQAGLVSRAEASEAHARAILQAVPEGVVTIDSQGVIRSFSPAAERIFGWRAEDVIGRSVQCLNPAAEGGRNDVPLPAYLQDAGSPVVGGGPREVDGMRRDGSIFPMDLSVNAAEIGGETLFVATLRDATERRMQQQVLRRAKEDAEQAAKAKSEFLAMMSHEIRTPLNGILGMVQLLQDSGLSDTQQDYAETIHMSGKALLGVLNDILDFSKLEAGRMDLEAESFDPVAVVRGVATLLSGEAAEKGLRFSTEVADGLPATVVGDAGRVRQVLLNLVSNAIKFTERGGVSIGLSLAEPDGLRFTVTDTGIGVAEDAKVRLFSHFAQADTSISRRFGGTGLGLAISKKIVLLMGGDIGVESVLGEGASFWFTMPMRPGGSVGERAPVETPDDADTATLRILLVGDVAGEARAALGPSAERRHAVTVAGTGRAALDRIQDGQFDIVLMDMSAPGLDGIQTARAIRDLGGVASEVPILALTANVSPLDVAAYVDAGMDGHLGKPVERAGLQAALVEAIAARREAVAAARSRGALDGGEEAPVADPQTLSSLRQALGDYETTDILRLFVTDTRRLLLRMSQSGTAGNRAAVRELAHDLRSTAGNFGFVRLQMAAATVESCTDEGDLEALIALIDDLFLRLDEALAVLDAQCPEVMRGLAPDPVDVLGGRS